MLRLMLAVLLASALVACHGSHDGSRRKDAGAEQASAAEVGAAHDAAGEPADQPPAEKDVPFPYAAIITCSMGSLQFDLLQCFSGTSTSPDTNLELKNGDKYDLYQPGDLDRLGQRGPDGLRIELARNFDLTMQNASDSLILGIKIVNNIPSPDFGKVVFEKKVGEFGVIKISN